MDVVEVLWEDAWVDCKDYSISEMSALAPVKRRTVGYKIRETSQCIILATDLYEQDKTTVHTVMIIPWSAVLELWDYE